MYELKEELNIENMIYEIRGVQVMLDSDLARLYECKNGTKEINQAVEEELVKHNVTQKGGTPLTKANQHKED